MRYGLRHWRVLALLAAALMLSSCASTDENTWGELKSARLSAGPMMEITGTVTRSDLEGGLYLIRDAEGKNFNPTNLPQALRIDGLAIEATAQRRDDLVSIGMVGSLVDLVRIRQRFDSTGSISGTINYRERLALPPDAVVEVQLLDVSRQDVPATVLGTASVFTHDRQVPIPFTLAYDRAKILDEHTYAVRAVIRSAGALVFTTATRYPVITRGNPSHADLILVRVAASKAILERLRGTVWTLEDLAGVGVVDTVQATLMFFEAATPAPVPKIDRAIGVSVYHAVTEANELRVVIEPTRCADVMSAKPFEKTVIVTLNGQTYCGCGESVR